MGVRLLGVGVGHMELATVFGTRFPCGLDQLLQILEKQPARGRGTVLLTELITFQLAFGGLVGPTELLAATPKAKGKQRPALCCTGHFLGIVRERSA